MYTDPSVSISQIAIADVDDNHARKGERLLWRQIRTVSDNAKIKNLYNYKTIFENQNSHIPQTSYFTGVHLTGVHLIGVHLTGVYFMDVYLTGVYLMEGFMRT
jgi:hypothetical protein